MKKIFLFSLTILSHTLFRAQSLNVLALNGQTINPITTAVPFLMISPDSKQGGMGDVGAATDPDINAIHWNGSKLAMTERKFGFGFTVTPWLRQLVPDINLYYMAGYCKLNDRQTVGGSLRYFSLGNIELTNNQGVKTSDYRPNEFSLDGAFSQKLSKYFSLGIALRYINSGISKVYVGGSSGNAAQTFAADLSMYFKSNRFKISDKYVVATAGAAFTNLGAKIKYSNDENFIPMNLRLGGGLKTEIDKYNTIGFYLDFNKLLVPTPPIYKYTTDSAGIPRVVIDPVTGDKEIASGKNPKVPVTSAILQSFYDAPGGIREELREINTSVGIEYLYNNIFALRTGYFYESKNKGGRQYFTIGMGVKYSIINIDGSYLIPTAINNPLQRTWRISISFDFEKAKKDADPVQP
jgi:hypothetical protein